MKNKTYHNDMNITQKLYDVDAYATEFSAKVISCDKKSYNNGQTKTEGFALVLDKTLFFPEEGGQSCDKGTVDSVAVEHVAIADGKIEHFVSVAFEQGAQVCGKIDFSHRYRNMQHHSAEHIFSGLASALFGVKNVGFHLGKEFMTMDYDAVLTKEMIDKIESFANEVIYKNLDISAKYYDAEELCDVEYRAKIDIRGDIRIVTIPDVDVCACCAPHVAKTGEIGIIKVTDFEKYKGGTRVYVVCADDALCNYRMQNDDITAMSRLFSVKKEDVLCGAQKLVRENERLCADLSALNKKYCVLLAQSFENTDKPICVFESGIGAGGMRIVANELVAKTPLALVFDLKENDMYNFIMASEKLNCKDLIKTISASLNAKGGGSEKMVQGTICAEKAKIQEFFENVDLA